MGKDINYVISKKDKKSLEDFGEKVRSSLLFGRNKIPKGLSGQMKIDLTIKYNSLSIKDVIRF